MVALNGYKHVIFGNIISRLDNKVKSIKDRNEKQAKYLESRPRQVTGSACLVGMTDAVVIR